jgi:hypothetical protein
MCLRIVAMWQICREIQEYIMWHRYDYYLMYVLAFQYWIFMCKNITCIKFNR